MKKEEIRIGMTVMHNVHGVGEVIEIKGNKVGLKVGWFLHEVNASDLVSKVEPISEIKPDTRHHIEIGYDMATTSLFITIDKKETICIANVSPNVLNFLVENYQIHPISTAEKDLEQILAKA